MMNEMTTENLCEMNGPVELLMSVYIVDDSTGEAGKVQFTLSMFKYPNAEDIARRLEKFATEELPKISPTARLATKAEAWSHAMVEFTGQPSKLIAHEEWDPITGVTATLQ